MPVGGRRPGSGRKLGSATKRTREVANAAIANGITPLEYMLGRLRDPEASADDKRWAANAAAPYVHPRLASTVVQGGSSPVRHDITVRFIKAEKTDS